MRYFLFLLFALPVQAQYLEFEFTRENETDFYSLSHEVYTGDESRIMISLVQKSDLICEHDADLLLALYFFPAIIEPPTGVYLNITDRYGDEESGNVLFIHDAESKTEGTVYLKGISINELKDINGSYFDYTLEGHDLYKIHDAIDEYLKQVLALPACG